jgi:ubiquinol-cytochrome c reductase cytochrome b subunit
LPFYAILRSIPDKLGGVLAMGAAILIFLLLPFLQKFSISSSKFDVLSQFFFLIIYCRCNIIGLTRCSISGVSL